MIESKPLVSVRTSFPAGDLLDLSTMVTAIGWVGGLFGIITGEGGTPKERAPTLVTAVLKNSLRVCAPTLFAHGKRSEIFLANTGNFFTDFPPSDDIPPHPVLESA
jgi:hypothetical protein